MAWLDPMPVRARVAFGASCAERLYPLFEAFSLDAKREGTTLLRDAIDELWNVALNGSKNVTTDAGDILQIGPRSHEHVSPFTFAAQYAVSCVIHAQQAISAGTSDEATWCSIVSRDCINDYLDWVASSRFDSLGEPNSEASSPIDWWESPLMRGEMQKQYHDLKLIFKAASIDLQLIRRLRTEGALGIAPFQRHLIR